MIGRRKLTVAALALFMAASLPVLAAPRADDANRKSKNGKAEGSVAGVGVVVEYGRPSVQGRTIFGDIVPFGKVWRTGADEATTITFAKDVAIEGAKLAAGTYSLFTIPGENEWTIVFNRVAEQWGAFKYDATQDALRVTVKPETTAPVEALEFVLEPSRVVLRWEKVAVGFTVAAG